MIQHSIHYQNILYYIALTKGQQEYSFPNPSKGAAVLYKIIYQFIFFSIIARSFPNIEFLFIDFVLSLVMYRRPIPVYKNSTPMLYNIDLLYKVHVFIIIL
jgi:hypothetical protein